VDAVRRAVREELRRGASHIKLMASGGVASPTDPLERCQYSASGFPSYDPRLLMQRPCL
jgi:imidazolonepropionase-like amidohydrolase